MRRFSPLTTHPFLVMEPILAYMHHRLAIVEKAAGRDFGQVKVVIAGRQAVQHPAVQVGMCFLQDRPMRGGTLDFEVLEGVVRQREAFAEMSDHVSLGGFENVEREDGVLRQELRDRPAPLHDEGDHRRAERALLNPAREQSCFDAVARQRQDEDTAGDPAERGAQVFVRIAAVHFLTLTPEPRFVICRAASEE